METEKIVARLKQEGLRMTKPREKILDVLQSTSVPLSAEDIQRDIDSIDLVTVYRNVETFLHLGVVHRIILEGGKQVFQIESHSHHHHHIICRECHKAECLDFCAASKIEKQAKALGFTQLTHVFEVYGLCTECQN